MRPQKGRVSSGGNSWMLYPRGYVEAKIDGKRKFISYRELNKEWGGRPTTAREQRAMIQYFKDTAP